MRPAGLLVVGALLGTLAPSLLHAQCALDSAAARAGGAAAAQAAGLDVSHYQGTVQWSRLPAQGIHFAFVKATDGVGGKDPLFTANWTGAREAGVLRGAYHFFRAEHPGDAQAEHFLSQIGALEAGDLPPVLDIEVTDNTATPALVEGALQWLQAVEARTGRLPIVYTDPYFGRTYLADARFAKYPLWIADYSADPTRLPGAWNGKEWSFWQHSEKGQVPGIEGPVDLNAFRGSPADLRRFACSTTVVASAPR